MSARLAHLSKLASDPAYRLEVERSCYEQKIKALEEKLATAAARDAAYRELSAEAASVRRELIAARSEADQLKVANADLQRKLQDDETAMRSLQSANADLQRQLRALNNITTFLAEVARGEMRGER
jgi:predicted  nucleic acid-binding Zn-ribbon protein